MHVSEEYDRAVYVMKLVPPMPRSSLRRYYDDIIGRTYIFGLDFHWLKEAPNKYFTDAFHVGNVSHFLYSGAG